MVYHRRQCLIAMASAGCLLVRFERVSHANEEFNVVDDRVAGAVVRARKFLLDLIDPELDLLPEFSGHSVVWLYHDNYLAAKVLAKTNPNEARRIQSAIQRFGVSKSGKIELLFGESQLPLRRYELRDVAKAGKFTIRSEFTTDALQTDTDSYADLLFFQAIAEKRPEVGEAAFEKAMSMWDGVGFHDRVVRKAKQYATYKLALSLMAAKEHPKHAERRRDTLDQVTERLFKMQSESGGWITDYRYDGTPVGFANVETTALAIIGLES